GVDSHACRGGEAGRLAQVFSNVGVGRAQQLRSSPLENNASVAENQELGVKVSSAPVRHWQHFVLLAIEVMTGHGKGVLQAVCHQQRAGLIDVALLHDQLDDCVGSDGIESAGRGIVEQDLGVGDNSA